MLIKKIFFLPLIGLVMSCSSYNQVTSKKEVSVVADISSNQEIPFVVHAQKNRQLFRSSIWGIKIVDILVDGEKLEPLPNMIIISPVDTPRIKNTSDVFVYDVSVDDLTFDHGNKTMPSVKTYSIPSKTKRLVIRYQLRYADNHELSPVHTLTVLKNFDEWKPAFGIENSNTEATQG